MKEDAKQKIALMLRISEYLESVSDDFNNFMDELCDIGGEICTILICNDLEKSAAVIRKEAAYIRKMAEAIRVWEEIP